MTLREPLQRVLGDAFVIERELTGGGMAHLYVVLDTSLNRRVVVKVLPRERAEGVSAERFRGEIRTVAALQHPNIVGIISAGEVEGLPYYVMPFIDGESLRTLLVREGSMSTRAVVAILRDVARACAYAHGRDIVHRDIKPDNVMLSGGAALITDFGIAKALTAAQRPSDSTSTLTRDGFTVGTPMYMAPEQLAGDPHIDHRVDFYAMGVMAYEMLAGKVPFSQPTPRALLAAQLSEPPTPLRQHRPDVPVRLARLVADCLQKEPAGRPASADLILAALDDPAILSDEFVSGGIRESVPALPVAAPRRTRRAGIGLAVAAVFVVVAGALLVRGVVQKPAAADSTTRSEASVALLPFRDESPDSSGGYLAEGLSAGIGARLTGVRGLRVVSAPKLQPSDSGRETGAATLLSGRVIRTGDRVEVTTTLVDGPTGAKLGSQHAEGTIQELGGIEATLAGDAAAALATRFVGMGRPVLPVRETFHSAPAYDEYLQGIYAFRHQGAAAPQQTLQHLHMAESLDSMAVPVYVSLAEVYTALPASSTIAPDAALAKALGFAEHAVAIDSASAAARMARGRVLEQLWRWELAATDLVRAVALDSTAPGVREAYGRHLLLQGNVDGAEREFSAAAAAAPGSAEIAGFHGVALALSGQIERGLRTAQRGVDLEPGQPGPRLLLGEAYLYAARPFDGVFTLAGAVELDPSNPEVLGMLGYAYAAMSQPAKARTMLARLAKNPARPGTAAAMARIHVGLGQPDEALGLLERAVQVHDPIFAEESLFTPIWEPLKRHPRFERLLARVGLAAPN
ncbi:MAG TPA: protein kinase [Gemmatimonadales bacterium]|nr:protein kinase [Gemmatimonadales bacterium]